MKFLRVFFVVAIFGSLLGLSASDGGCRDTETPGNCFVPRTISLGLKKFLPLTCGLEVMDGYEDLPSLLSSLSVVDIKRRISDALALTEALSLEEPRVIAFFDSFKAVSPPHRFIKYDYSAYSAYSACFLIWIVNLFRYASRVSALRVTNGGASNDVITMKWSLANELRLRKKNGDVIEAEAKAIREECERIMNRD